MIAWTCDFCTYYTHHALDVGTCHLTPARSRVVNARDPACLMFSNRYDAEAYNPPEVSPNAKLPQPTPTIPTTPRPVPRRDATPTQDD